jgi:hypothetical protein
MAIGSLPYDSFNASITNKYENIKEGDDTILVEFIVILVDTPEQAQKLNSALGHLTTPSLRLYAIWSGQTICGLRHGPSRPTKVIDLITNRNFALFNRWYNDCIKPLKEARHENT